jgi:hypothetical protein
MKKTQISQFIGGHLMRNKLIKKFVSSVVIACLLFSSFGVAFGATAASTTKDIKGHWAEAQISSWID